MYICRNTREPTYFCLGRDLFSLHMFAIAMGVELFPENVATMAVGYYRRFLWASLRQGLDGWGWDGAVAAAVALAVVEGWGWGADFWCCWLAGFGQLKAGWLWQGNRVSQRNILQTLSLFGRLWPRWQVARLFVAAQGRGGLWHVISVPSKRDQNESLS